MGDIDSGDTVAVSSCAQSNVSSSSSSEFHENYIGSNNTCNSNSSANNDIEINRSIGSGSMPDFVPTTASSSKKSSWRLSHPPIRTGLSDSGSKIFGSNDGEDLPRIETGSMKESKTFAFGVRHLHDSDSKGQNTFYSF